MATNLDIDDYLLTEAKRIGKHRTKREAVNAALAEYIAYRRRLELVRARGTVDFADGVSRIDQDIDHDLGDSVVRHHQVRQLTREVTFDVASDLNFSPNQAQRLIHDVIHVDQL